MERRDFLKLVSLVAGTNVLSNLESLLKPAPAYARRRIRWRMVSSFPKSLDVIYGGGEIICEFVKYMTDGRFDIRIYAAGEIVPGLKVLDAVGEGSVQCGHTCTYYYIGKNQALAFGSTLPFGFTTRVQNAWLYEGGGNKLINEILSDFNVIGFPAGNCGVQMGGWFRKPIKSLHDLKGLRMRIPGLGGKVMARVGVSVQVLAGGEIYPALERGAIDATEWVGPYDDEKLGFYKIVKYYHYPGWHEPGTTIHFIVNKNAWNRLPKEYQEVLKAATYVANSLMISQYDAKNPPALKRLLNKGVKLVKFPDDMLNKLQEVAFDMYEELASKDRTYRKIYTNWKTFGKMVNSWFGTNELTMTKILYRV